MDWPTALFSPCFSLAFGSPTVPYHHLPVHFSMNIVCALWLFFFFFWRGVGGWSFESARRDEQGTLDEQQRTRWWHFSQQRPRQLLLFSQDRVPPKLDKREEPEGEYFKRGRCSARSWKSWRSQESVLSPAAPKIIMSSETLRSAQRICCLFLRTWTENQVRIYLSRRAAEPKLTCIHLGRASANWHVPRWVKIKKTRLRINIQLMQLKKKKCNYWRRTFSSIHLYPLEILDMVILLFYVSSVIEALPDGDL